MTAGLKCPVFIIRLAGFAATVNNNVKLDDLSSKHWSCCQCHFTLKEDKVS